MQGAPRPRLSPVVGKARKAVGDLLGVGTTGGQRKAAQASGNTHARPLILVACSGGPDSLALAAVAAFLGRRGEIQVGAVIVDHQLQPQSRAVAEATAGILRGLGLDPVEISTVTSTDVGVGPEAAARNARYAALDEAAARLDARTMLLGHTLDDQAESVLLGLARGSGTRSLAGIPQRRGLYLRPFLGLRRAETLQICAAEGLQPWHDPTNEDPAFLRSRVRTRVLPFLQDELGPGIAQSLSRSARILAQDADYLDQQAAAEYHRLAEILSTDSAASREVRISEAELRALPAALRQRVLALAVVGLDGEQPSFERLLAAEALLARRGSAGPVELAGSVSVYRQPRGRSVPQERSGYGKLVFRRTA
ncbi:tRNA lysidine(34) synthetase TilS [Paeniglutamicibacter antarcticus]|uniref:tRNA(Ile)-lysidine synthase n=1 Tax=Arthrobacter terrae TaxID=2935737 RepID=A0A931G5S1_9MICC|nr:tRNA lysidine(34) synthetase TilS [Arthrobacter terrae]MBG0739870.1 tRNA lysidine(34) synthetase TilS [Arthrobacter terrae]